jgi:hypothetical protein
MFVHYVFFSARYIQGCLIWFKHLFACIMIHITLEHKLIDIWTNVLNIDGGLLWEANTNAQFILDPYVVASYCTFYLTKTNTFVT